MPKTQADASPSAVAAPAATGPAAPTPKIPAWLLALAVLAFAAGLGARYEMFPLATKYAYLYDHCENTAMGVAAERFGLFNVYKADKADPLRYQVFNPAAGTFVLQDNYLAPRVAPNYPPLGVAIFQLQVKLLKSLDPTLTLNTVQSRIVMSLAALLGDLALAVGVFLLARLLGSARAGLGAAMVCWLFPPLVMDSCYWGQTDSLFLAPAVFILWLMLRRRWLLAGALIGLATLIKPQGILLAPVALMGSLLVDLGPAAGAAKTVLIRLAKQAGAALAVLLLLSLPWTFSDHGQWLDRAYFANFKLYPEITLKAFNIWYLDALSSDAAPTMNDIDSTATVADVSKDAWGKLFLFAALVTLGVLTWRRGRKNPNLALVLFAGLWLWSTFIWPTRVHERYIVYGIPLMIAAAFSVRRLWPALLILALVGAFEMCHTHWLTLPPGKFGYFGYATMMNAKEELVRSGARPDEGEQKLESLYRHLPEKFYAQRQQTRGYEYLLTLGSLLAYGWAVWTCMGGLGGGPAPAAPAAPPGGQAAKAGHPGVDKTARRRK